MPPSLSGLQGDSVAAVSVTCIRGDRLHCFLFRLADTCIKGNPWLYASIYTFILQLYHCSEWGWVPSTAIQLHSPSGAPMDESHVFCWCVAPDEEAAGSLSAVIILHIVTSWLGCYPAWGHLLRQYAHYKRGRYWLTLNSTACRCSRKNMEDRWDPSMALSVFKRKWGSDEN